MADFTSRFWTFIMNLWATITPTWQVIDQLNSFSRHSVEEFAWNSSDWPSPLGLTMYFKVISRISSCWMLRKMWSVGCSEKSVPCLLALYGWQIAGHILRIDVSLVLWKASIRKRLVGYKITHGLVGFPPLPFLRKNNYDCGIPLLGFRCCYEPQLILTMRKYS